MLQGIRAVYDLSEIRAVRGSKRPPIASQGPTNQPAATGPFPSSSPAENPEHPVGQRLETLSDMLQEHFVEEVRVRDRDGDGRLNRREYGGTKAEFDTLDRDRDGLVGARDMSREAVARNESLKEIMEGPWSSVYDGFLKLEDPSAEELEVAVCGLCRENQLNAEQFFEEHPDLSALHGRLSQLADRLGRNRRYHPVDLNL